MSGLTPDGELAVTCAILGAVLAPSLVLLALKWWERRAVR